jgi:hypothetical protein
MAQQEIPERAEQDKPDQEQDGLDQLLGNRRQFLDKFGQ